MPCVSHVSMYESPESHLARCGFRIKKKIARRYSSSPSYYCAKDRTAMAVRIDGLQKDISKDDSASRLPPEEELLCAFEEVLNKMDLPPDKMRILRSYDLNKKWELRRMYAVADPSVYLEKLAVYLDRRASKKVKSFPLLKSLTITSLLRKKLLGDETSTKILKHIEISLRTNSIDWVRMFLNDQNNGLGMLIDYLTQLQEDGNWGSACNDLNQDGPSSSGAFPYSHTSQTHTSAVLNPGDNDHFSDEKITGGLFRRTISVTKKNSRNYGDRDDDIHVCVSCLRAIMNNKYGFNMVFNNPQAIYCIARSILHQSLRIKALALELLAAICLVNGGHDLIINAFNRFRSEYKETYRFQLLFSYFIKPPEFNVDFMASCMQFFNIVVHSTESMNYRSYLQYELTLLGLDDYLEVLRNTECEQLQTHVNAYLDNKIDVHFLLDETDKKVELEAENNRLIDELSKIKERLQVVEADYIARLAQLDRRLKELNAEKEKLLKEHDSKLSTMRRTLNEKDKASREQQAKLESRIQELERMQANMKAGLLEAKKEPASTTNPPSPPPPPPGPHQGKEPSKLTAANHIPPPPPPPQVNNAIGKLPPPPPPPLLNSIRSSQLSSKISPPASDVMTIKKIYNTRNKLPLLNWCPLKPNQVKDTVFNNLDDEKIMDKIDFTTLEDLFKIGVAKRPDTTESYSPGQQSPIGTGNGSTIKKNTILDTKRLQNIAITCRKLAMSAPVIMSAVHRMDLKALIPESVDILIKIAPTHEEIVKFKEYELEHKNFSDLSDEDQFLAQLVKIERFEHKIKIMSFMATFDESADLLEPLYGLKSSVERSLSLLHIIAETVSRSFPGLLDFADQLKFADKASTIMWEAVLADMRELEANFASAKKERELKGGDCPPSLLDFLDKCEKRISVLQVQYKTASEAFTACVEFYGESSRNQQPHTFFSRLLTFAKRFQQAVAENEARHAAAERSQGEQMKRQRIGVRRRVTKDEVTENVIDELVQRIGMTNPNCELAMKTRKPKLDSSQIDDGDFERIMNGLKEGAYVTFDGAQGTKRYSSSFALNSKKSLHPPPVGPKTNRTSENHEYC
uniref:GBD/FH3 domain-containing protein n=1 Tax=Wuchereria bancrofti TaxID=6293 RepID=A0A1I8EIQ5_WUCBA